MGGGASRAVSRARVRLTLDLARTVHLRTGRRDAAPQIATMADTYHRGRLIDHVHLRVADLAASKRFYRAVLAAVGREPSYESDEAIGFDELWIDTADGAGP